MHIKQLNLQPTLSKRKWLAEVKLASVRHTHGETCSLDQSRPRSADEGADQSHPHYRCFRSRLTIEPLGKCPRFNHPHSPPRPRLHRKAACPGQSAGRADSGENPRRAPWALLKDAQSFGDSPRGSCRTGSTSRRRQPPDATPAAGIPALGPRITTPIKTAPPAGRRTPRCSGTFASHQAGWSSLAPVPSPEGSAEYGRKP